MESKIKWYEKEVTWGMLIKIVLLLNVITLAFCYKVCSISTTKDAEHLEYDAYLENRIETQSKLIDLLWEERYE